MCNLGLGKWSGPTKPVSSPRSAIFMVADDYRLEDEQRALVSGIAGYLVRPITLDVIRATRDAACTPDVAASHS